MNTPLPLSAAEPPDLAGATDTVADPDPVLPAGTRLGGFEIQQVEARGQNSVVYLATDHALDIAVAIQEYFPKGLVVRDAWRRMKVREPAFENTVAQGLLSFIDEARMLARCDHPALVRVLHMFELYGTAYRVMPYYSGMSLLDRRRGWESPPDEDWLRDWMSPMLGALEALHRIGRVHGGVSPESILLLEGDRPMLMGPGASQHQLGSSLVDLLMASVETPRASRSVSPGALAAGIAADLCALAEVARFCITGEWPAQGDTPLHREPIAGAIERLLTPTSRSRYRSEWLSALDAAMSPQVADRPASVAQLRDWLEHGAPSCRVSLHAGAPAPTATAGSAPPAASGSTAGAAAPARAASTAGPSAVPPATPALPGASEGHGATRPQSPTPPAAVKPAVHVAPVFHLPTAAAATATAPGGAPAAVAPPPTAAIPVLTAALDSTRPMLPDVPAAEGDEFPSMWPALSAILEGLDPKEAAPAKAPAPAAAIDGPLWSASAPMALSQPPARPAAASRRQPRTPWYNSAAAVWVGAALVMALFVGAGVYYWKQATTLPPDAAASLASTSDDAGRSDPGAVAPPADESPARANALVRPGADGSFAPAPTSPVAPAAPARGRSDGRNAAAAAAAAAAVAVPSGARTAVDGPRAACAPRTDFALYRCVKELCATSRWTKSAQCEHLRETDEVQ